jgi:hypothetical protein
MVGCMASKNVHLTPQNKNKIKTVYIDPNVKVPKGIVYQGKGHLVGQYFGLVGELIGAKEDQKTGVVVQRYAQKNHINIAQIINDQWKRQLKEKNLFKPGSSKSDAVLSTEVVAYGFQLANGINSSQKPMLALYSKLTRNGEVVWRKYMVDALLFDSLAYKYDVYMNNKNIFFNMWDNSAQKLVGYMIADLES